MPVTKVRVARPTDDPEALHDFYAECLGLEFLGSFEGHAGYDGWLYGTLDGLCEIEFTRHTDGSPCPPPSVDNLLVFYLPTRAAIHEVEARLRARGHAPVEPANPYWVSRGPTYADPDGWRVVLFDLETL